MKVVQEHFNSIHQLLKTIEGRRNNQVMSECDSSHAGDYDFTLTESWNDALGLLRYGYTDILKEIKAGIKEQTKFRETTKRRIMKTSTVGIAPHVPNAILGMPNAMIDYETKVQKTKTISIVYIETAVASEGTGAFIKSGITLLSTIQALEMRGYRVKLKIMIYCGKCDGERAFATVNVKDYREHLDLHKLCFPLAHPSMFRRIGFKWLETVPGLTVSTWARGYGQAIHDEELFELEDMLEDNEYFLSLDSMKKCGYNIDRVIDYLKLQ